jgi:hypothetical protein
MTSFSNPSASWYKSCFGSSLSVFSVIADMVILAGCLLPILKTLSRTYERKLSAATEAHRSARSDPHQIVSNCAISETMPWSTGSAGPFSSQMRLYISSSKAMSRQPYHVAHQATIS